MDGSVRTYNREYRAATACIGEVQEATAHLRRLPAGSDY